MTSYVTRQGDMVDYICWRYYGNERGTVEMVLAANPGLANLGSVLGAGITITLPEMTATSTQDNTIKLWD